MTPARAAQIYAAAFPMSRAWTEAEIADLMAPPGLFAALAHGFMLGRVSADQAELLTLAVDPAQRRRGAGRALLAQFEHLAGAAGAAQLFLEVAEDNTPAIGLYDSAGWRQIGRRESYYRRSGQAAVAALVYEKQMVNKSLTGPDPDRG